MARLSENRYGKSRVRLSRITRHGDRHEFNEWTVHLLLEGDFDSSFTEADNSKVLPTDTMKNTVYFVARNSKAETIEEFAIELGDYLLNNNLQITTVSVKIEEKAWVPMMIDGTPEATTFRLRGSELNTEDRQIGLHRLRPRQADHAQAGYGPHLRHSRNREMGVRRGLAGLCAGKNANHRRHAQGVRSARQHERAAYAV